MKHNRKDNAVEWQPVKQRIKWIDCAKTVAIIGVLIDHNNGLLYTNQVIAKGSYFGVSLFILLAGITAFYTTDVVRGGGGQAKKLASFGQDIVAICKSNIYFAGMVHSIF